jgi:hypothetical protein
VDGQNPAKTEIPVPMLERGNYLVDLRILDAEKKILDFISKSFRVESGVRVKSVGTEKVRYLPGEVMCSSGWIVSCLGGTHET